MIKWNNRDPSSHEYKKKETLTIASPSNNVSRLWCGWISVIVPLHHNIQIVQKKLQPAFGYRLQKNRLWNQKNQTGLWNYDYFSTIQWKSHLIWPNNHKEIWIFVKQVTGPFFPSFVTWMYMNVCGFHRQIVFTKDRLSNIFKFHAYLSNKGCSWQPKTLSDM